MSLAQSKQTVQEEDEIELGEQQTNPFYLQSCAAYMFHKILSNEKYGIGSLLHTSINNFNNEYKDAKNSSPLLPLPMKKAVYLTSYVDQLWRKWCLTCIRISTMEGSKCSRLCLTVGFPQRNMCSRKSMPRSTQFTRIKTKTQ